MSFNISIRGSGLITLLLVVLKLAGVIAWSWWWVLAPMWLPVAVVLVIFTVMFIFTALIPGIILLFYKGK